MISRTAPRRFGATLLAVVASAATLAACGDDANTDTASQATEVAGIAVTNAKDLNKKPGIDIPDELPPNELVKEDLVVGTGKTVKASDELTARYVGVAWGSNKEFDSSWEREPKESAFSLNGGVIEGWTEGLAGMKLGGRRLLIVPPEQGYGAQGQGEDIPANETLVFIVDAKSARKAPEQPDPAAGGQDMELTQEQIQQLLQQQQAGQ